MKKIISVILFASVLSCLFTGCLNTNETSNNVNTEVVSKYQDNISEDELNKKIHSMKKLATVEVYYHNVGESIIDPKDGITHLGESQRKYWVEYTGSAKIGIDTSKIEAKIKGNVITISMPKPEIIDWDWNSKNAETFVTPDSFNSNEINSEVKDETINTAQKTMREEIEKNSALFRQSEDNAKSTIQSFVDKMSEVNGIQYNIKWVESK